MLNLWRISLVLMALAMGVVSQGWAQEMTAGSQNSAVALPSAERSKAIYAEAISISKLLRDPASANYTLFDSESAIAGELKARIYEMLREGKSREEIFDFMVERYGEMIRYEPDFNAKTALLWAAPWMALAVGGGLLFVRLRQRRRIGGKAQQK